MIEYCRSNANETNIVNEMRRVMETTSDSGINETAHALLRFLEEKYDTKKWLVIVISSDSGIANPSGGFHVASSNGTHALAITNGAHTSDDGFLLSPRQRQYLEEFTCPLIVSEKRRTPTRNYLYRYLTPLRTSNRFDVETLIARNGYMVFHNDSEFVEWENASCGSDYTVLVVPTARPRPIAPDIEFEPSCFPQNQSDGFMMLRNDFLQGYLSVEGDSEVNGARVVVDRQWKNNSGQRWRFVNNKLMNGHGKCLMRKIANKRYILYQNDCNVHWGNHYWFRKGLQIAYGVANNLTSGFCVVAQPSYQNINNEVLYALVEPCDDNALVFFWYDWDISCEDAMVINNSTDDTNKGRLLRNEHSRQFLTLHQRSEGTVESLMNLPGQRWRFHSGSLENDAGICLKGKGKYILKEDCATAANGSNRWTYNDKRQIVSNDGYCLTVGEWGGSSYAHYTYCSDVAENRWWLMG